MGFILKTTHNLVKESIPLLMDGIATNDTGTNDARFYFHLGDALQRLGNNKEAYEVTNCILYFNFHI